MGIHHLIPKREFCINHPEVKTAKDSAILCKECLPPINNLHDHSPR
jgi:hypothetical protein